MSRIAIRKTIERNAEYWGKYYPIYHANGFNHPMMPIINNLEAKNIEYFKWGLIPSWIQNNEEAKSISLNNLNARSETVFNKKSFSRLVSKQRCIIPANGFYEWKDVNGKKYPFYISLKNQEMFFFAGLWDEWYDKNNQTHIRTFTLLTTESNPLLSEIHNLKKRMPVILQEQFELLWLKNNISEMEVKQMTVPFPSELMQAHTISNLISSKSLNSNVPEVSKHFIYPELENINYSLFD